MKVIGFIYQKIVKVYKGDVCWYEYIRTKRQIYKTKLYTILFFI
jgi:hypothetical protein